MDTKRSRPCNRQRTILQIPKMLGVSMIATQKCNLRFQWIRTGVSFFLSNGKFSISQLGRPQLDRGKKIRTAISMDTYGPLIFFVQRKILLKKGVITFSSANLKKMRAGRKNDNHDFNGFSRGCRFFGSSAIFANILPTIYNYFFSSQNCNAISRSCPVGRLKHFLQVLAARRITNHYSLGGFASAEKNAKREIQVLPRGSFNHFCSRWVIKNHRPSYEFGNPFLLGPL